MTRAQEQFALWLETLQDDPIYGEELLSLEGKEEEISERFQVDLEFGTAGLRGVMGAGTNRMNLYVVGKTTQGLANFLNETVENPTVAVAYDSRNFSQLFAKHVAGIFAANNIKVHIFSELMPTPTLSYAIREYGCDSGVNITASHNPAKYNGYKAYGPDGSQLSTEASGRVMEIIQEVDIFGDVKTMDFDKAVEDGIVSMIPDSFVQQYVDRVFAESLQPEVCEKADLSIVYTPLNGAGRKTVLAVLDKCGVKDITLVPEQEFPDGNFPTAPYPNPETKEALQLGLELSKKNDADILIATDPDCDRLGVAVKHGDDFQILTGNEVGVLLLDYIINTRKKLGTLPKDPFTIRTIVTTKLTDAIAEASGVTVRPTLTGFKHIGLILLEAEETNSQGNCIFSYEESCGYLAGAYVRDKDAVNASMLTIEMASAYKLEGKTLVDVLDGFRETYGHYLNFTQNFAFAGLEGMEIMSGLMADLRENPPKEIGGYPITAYVDYKTSVRTEAESKAQSKVDILPSNVLEYEFENKSSVIIRPSGTEPKIKAYYLIRGESESVAQGMLDKTVESFTGLLETLAGQELDIS